MTVEKIHLLSITEILVVVNVQMNVGVRKGYTIGLIILFADVNVINKYLLLAMLQLATGVNKLASVNVEKNGVLKDSLKID